MEKTRLSFTAADESVRKAALPGASFPVALITLTVAPAAAPDAIRRRLPVYHDRHRTRFALPACNACGWADWLHDLRETHLLTGSKLPGIPEYGCAISPEKRLTNFDVCLDEGEVVPPLPAGEGASLTRSFDGRHSD